MIIQEISNILPYDGVDAGIGKQESGTLPIIQVDETNDVCDCSCDYFEYVFVHSDNKDYKNDKSSFIDQKIINTDTIAFELFNGGVKIDDITDNTYGTLYETFSYNSLYVGLLIDWKKVYDAHGIGTYNINIVKSILGTDIEKYSHDFKLMIYDDYLADNTVKIETYQTGNIISNSINYESLLNNGWYDSMRVQGKLFSPKPKLTIDNYLNNDYTLLQIRDKITNEYELEIGLLPDFISNKIVYDKLLANKILITDYNIDNTSIFRKKELYCIELTEKKQFNFNKNCKFVVKLTDKKENIIKNNF